MMRLNLQFFGGRGSAGSRGSGGRSISKEQQLEAIHEYQQTSLEGLTQQQRNALYSYIEDNPDVKEQVVRGMQVQQSTIDRWIESGEIDTKGLSSWSTDGSVAAQFSNVSRSVDAENGVRSVLIVSQSGLPNSAHLPRTNAYKESEVLTSYNKFEVVSHRVQPSISGNKSPNETIIFVKPRSSK